MVRKYLKLVALLLLPVFVASAYATDGLVRISYEAIKTSINLYNPEDYAEYIIYIKNLGNETILVIPDIKPYDKWIAIFDPSTLMINPGNEGSMDVKIYAKGYEPFPNQAIISFYAYGQEYSVLLPIETYGIKIKKLPDLHIDYWTEPYAYPGQEIEINVAYYNKGNETLRVYLTLSSKAFEKDYRFMEILYPKSELLKKYKVKLRDNVAPGNYDISLIFSIDGSINTKHLNLAVKELPANVDFRVYGNKIIIRNAEDRYILYSFDIELSRLKAVFYKPSIEPTRIYYKNGTFVYHWDLVLGPKEEVELRFELRTDLVAIILLPIAVAIVLILGHYFLGYRVSIRKAIVKVDRKNKKIKIALYVSNKSKRKIKEVTIKDLVPPPFVVTEDYEFHEPALVNVTDDGTELIWVIRDLLPGEERVISYVLTYKTEPTGMVELPSAKIIRNGKVISLSLPVFIHFAK